MKKILILMAVGFIGFLIVAGCSQPAPVEETAYTPAAAPTPLATPLSVPEFKELVSKPAGKLKSGSFMFNAKAIRATGMPSYQKGPIIFRVPGDIRMELDVDEYDLLVLYYDNCAYTYDPVGKSLTKIDLSRLPEDFTDLMINSNPVSYFLSKNLNAKNVRILGMEKVDDAECYVFNISPARIDRMEDVGIIASEKAWVDKKSGLTHRVVLYNPAGRAVMTYEFSEIKINPDTPDSLFAPDVPEGTKIDDLTDRILDDIEKGKQEQSKPG